MKADAPGVFGCLRILEDHIGAAGNQVPVMIPDNDILVPQPLALQHRTQVILEEIPLFFRGVDHRFPTLNSHGFVLNGDTPDGNAFSLVGLDKLGKVHCPGLVVLRQQLAAPQHIVVALHKGGRTPGTGIEGYFTPGRFCGTLDHGNSKLAILLDTEGGKALVTLFNIGVAGTAKVRAVD